MIERKYFKDSTHAKQELSAIIHTDKKAVFHHLATTEGIAAWFPQLSMAHEEDEQLVLFDMGDGTFEKMKLLDYKTDDHISYEWATGKIEFLLEEAEEGTLLTLKEELTFDFPAIPEDFTGWFVQMQNIKSVAETGSPVKINKDQILQVKNDVRAKIKG